MCWNAGGILVFLVSHFTLIYGISDKVACHFRILLRYFASYFTAVGLGVTENVLVCRWVITIRQPFIFLFFLPFLLVACHFLVV